MTQENDAQMKKASSVATMDMLYKRVVNSPSNSSISSLLLSNKYLYYQNDFIRNLFSQLKCDMENSHFAVCPTKEMFLDEWEKYQLNCRAYKPPIITQSDSYTDDSTNIRSDFYKIFKQYGIDHISEGIT
jgi:hypothetical protein